MSLGRFYAITCLNESEYIGLSVISCGSFAYRLMERYLRDQCFLHFNFGVAFPTSGWSWSRSSNSNTFTDLIHFPLDRSPGLIRFRRWIRCRNGKTR